jgi:hypothetical protein
MEKGGSMRGSDRTTGSLFSYVDIEARVPAKHPLRPIRRIVNDVLAGLDAEFAALYEPTGRGSIRRSGCCAARCCRPSTRSAPSGS